MKTVITTLRAPLLDAPDDWQDSLKTFFKSGSITGPNNCWQVKTKTMLAQVIVHDLPLLKEDVEKAALFDIEENQKGIDWILQHQRHAIVVVEGNDAFECKTLASQIAQLIGGQALLWDDHAYIRPEVMSRIAQGELPEVFALFSIAAWEDDEENYGFITQGLTDILKGWLIMPVLTQETHAYSRTLARITLMSALLGEQGVEDEFYVLDPTDEEKTIGVSRENNLLYLFVPKENSAENS